MRKLERLRTPKVYDESTIKEGGVAVVIEMLRKMAQESNVEASAQVAPGGNMASFLRGQADGFEVAINVIRTHLGD